MAISDRPFDLLFGVRDHQEAAYVLWQSGYDTSEIASFLSIHESEALRLVSQQSSAVLDLPSPYPDTSVRSLSVRNFYMLSPVGGG